MMTRSIVGRFLILAVLLVSLGVIAQAALIITRGSGKAVAKAGSAPLAGPTAALASAMPATVPPSPAAAPAQGVVQPTAQQASQQAAQQTAQQADGVPVRVVYPGPLGDAAVPPRKFVAAALTATPIASATPIAPAAPAVQPAAAQAPAAPPPAAKPSPVVVASADADTQPAADGAGAASAANASNSATKGGVNLNSASVDALNRLGGGHIGQTIVKHRPYGSVEDLVKKRVIRRSVYEQIKDQVAAQ